LACLRDKNEDIRDAATEAVAQFGAAAAPGLARLLKENDAQIHAVKALGMIGAPAKTALPGLREAFFSADDKSAVKAAVAEALPKIGKDALPILVDALRDKRPEVRETALHALGEFGNDSVPLLFEALGHEGADVRTGAAREFGKMAVNEKAVILALADL